MALYAIGRQVYCRSQDLIGVVTEANYGPSRKATYVVQFGPGLDFLCGSSDLRAADYGCDGCGKTFAGRPHATADDGEYANGLRFCFLCAK